MGYFLITAWNNGSYHKTGGGYGLRVSTINIKKYFNEKWKTVFIKLNGEKQYINVNVNKKSFGDGKCGELIKKDIGKWLIKNNKVNWIKGCPPEFKMIHLTDNKFRVEFQKKI